jgi:hypothetical protein
VSTSELAGILSIAILLVAPALFALWRLRSLTLKVIAAAFAGFVTYFAVGASIAFATQHSSFPWFFPAHWIYFQLFGFATFVARMFAPEYTDELICFGPVPPGQDVGQYISASIVMGFWTLFFGTIYFYCARRPKPTI